MADPVVFNSANQTKWVAGGASNYIDRGLVDTPIKTIWDSYTFGNGETLTDMVRLKSPPKYSTIVNITVYVTADTGSTTFDIGDEADDDRYMSAISAALVGVHSIGQTFLAASNTVAAALMGNMFYHTGQADGDEQLILTVNTSEATEAVPVYFKIEYTS